MHSKTFNYYRLAPRIPKLSEGLESATHRLNNKILRNSISVFLFYPHRNIPGGVI